eukprot:5088569-Amphidinium_carterae.1
MNERAQYAQTGWENTPKRLTAGGTFGRSNTVCLFIHFTLPRACSESFARQVNSQLKLQGKRQVGSCELLFYVSKISKRCKTESICALGWVPREDDIRRTSTRTIS